MAVVHVLGDAGLQHVEDALADGGVHHLPAKYLVLQPSLSLKLASSGFDPKDWRRAGYCCRWQDSMRPARACQDRRICRAQGLDCASGTLNAFLKHMLRDALTCRLASPGASLHVRASLRVCFRYASCGVRRLHRRAAQTWPGTWPRWRCLCSRAITAPSAPCRPAKVSPREMLGLTGGSPGCPLMCLHRWGAEEEASS